MMQQRESFPTQLAFDQARIQGQQIENYKALHPPTYSGTAGQPAPQVDPNLQSAMTIDKKLQAGIFAQPGTLEGRNQLEQDLGQLVAQMRTNPSAQWSPQAVNIRNYFDNGGVPLPQGALPTPEELMQLLGPVRNADLLPTIKGVGQQMIGGVRSMF